MRHLAQWTAFLILLAFFATPYVKANDIRFASDASATIPGIPGDISSPVDCVTSSITGSFCGSAPFMFFGDGDGPFQIDYTGASVPNLAQPLAPGIMASGQSHAITTITGNYYARDFSSITYGSLQVLYVDPVFLADMGFSPSWPLSGITTSHETQTPDSSSYSFNVDLITPEPPILFLLLTGVAGLIVCLRFHANECSRS